MMNGFNQWICDFCGSACTVTNRANSTDYGLLARWHVCENCSNAERQVCFAVRHTAMLVATMFTLVDPKEPTNMYRLILHNKNLETKVEYIPNSSVYGNEKLLTVPYVAKGVTPKNVFEKIKLFLLMS